MEKDVQAALDRRLREELNGLQPAYQNGSWERLANRLEQELAPEQTDELLRNKLDQAAATTVPVGWEQLASRMGQESGLSLRESDDILRDKLSTLEAGLEPAGWAALASRLDNVESDEIFHYRLNHHASTPPLSGWAALAAKLELIAARRAAIYSYKFSEICLLITALLLFWHFQPGSGNEAPAQLIPIASLNDAETAGEKAQEKRAQELAVVTSSDQASIKSTATSPEFAGEIKPESGIEASRSTSTVRVEKIAVVDPAPASTDSWKFEIGRTGYENPQRLPGNRLELLDYARPKVGTPAKLKKNRGPGKIYLRAFISPWDINQIVTPRQAVNDIILDQDIRISYGSSAGVLVDVAHRKHLFQFGMIYGNRSYVPTVLKEVEDFPMALGPIEIRDTNYSRISFHTITVPAVFQRELIKSNHWRVAASVGIAVNLNTWATFRKSPTFDQDVLDWTRQTASPEFTQRSNATDLPRLDAVDLVYPEQGLFQGGSLLANSSLSASLGFSIERSISDRISVYVAPRFSRAIYYQKGAGLEPFNDRIHNNAVQFGTRVFLGINR